MEEKIQASKKTSSANGVGKVKIDFYSIYSKLILNWKWFLLSIIVCVGVAWLHLKRMPSIYEASERILIAGQDNNGGPNASFRSIASGSVSMSNGLDNEMEILKTHSLASQVVRDLKLYVDYYSVGKMKDEPLYKNQPVNVDIDGAHLDKITSPINLSIEYTNNTYHLTGTYCTNNDNSKNNGPFSLDKTFSSLPQMIRTGAGILTITANGIYHMKDGDKLKIQVMSPLMASSKYVSGLTTTPVNRTTNIINIVLDDVNQQRAMDYLQQLAICYNRQANEEKNQVALRTEQFINSRIEKLNGELGNTEGKIENFKKRNGIIDFQSSASNAYSQANDAESQLNDINTQIALLQEVQYAFNNQRGKYQLLPANVGISDGTVNSLIGNYNTIVQKRNLLLQSASENSPAVTPLTSQLDQLQSAINQSLIQAYRNIAIKRNAINTQYGKYQGQVSESPAQERALNQIGRQQEVKSSLYVMLLQKREENSISLAATADKGRLIDGPSASGKVSPNGSSILLKGLGVGIAIPIVILLLLQLFHYKIEGHDDVVKLTNLPILADVAVASDKVKENGEVVVKENQNNVMEEIFRSIRTNILFMLRENQKVILCTSTINGEGKSFISSNLAMSFALLGKKVILIGLDIRKPRLHHVFDIGGNKQGLTNLLTLNNPTWEDIKGVIKPSGKTDNLYIMPSGPIPPNPAELVARPSLESIFNTLREHFDYVIVDSAPVGMVTDTYAIGRACDATILVCRADYTPKSNFELINSLADEKKLPSISIVINGIDMSKKKYGYYYGYGRYGRYGRYGKTYGHYGTYGIYGGYKKSSYGSKDDQSLKQ